MTQKNSEILSLDRFHQGPIISSHQLIVSDLSSPKAVTGLQWRDDTFALANGHHFSNKISPLA